MGPRLCSRGEVTAGNDRVQGVQVAMGPRLCSRGETRRPKRNRGAKTSQWGHGFVAVER